MTKKIGIVGWKSESFFGAGISYLEFISSFGTPVIITPQMDMQDDLDLLVLPGGLDVNYGQVPSFYTSNTDVFKQHFYDTKLDSYINAGVPVFGICLGMQQLNVKLGGTLHQHILGHQRDAGSPHFVHIEDNAFRTSIPEGYKSLFQKPKEKDTFGVMTNSRHHQAVDKLADSLIATGFSREYGEQYVESFIHPSLPIAGVQWHPEDLVEESYSKYLIDNLLAYRSNIV